MAKSINSATLIATALCCLISISFAHESQKKTLFVQGKVYCDTCRVQFETKISTFLSGAKVGLRCRDRAVSNNVTYSVEGETDSTGTYNLPVEGDHEDEICEVHLLKSSEPDCSEIMQDLNSARVVITTDGGVAEPVRFANALGFMKKEAVGNCAQVLGEMGFLPNN